MLAQTCGAAGGLPTLAGHVVRLRGLPFASTAADVVAFFEGVDTVGGEAGVVFTCTPDGRPTGEAYVELAGPEALAGALARHKEKMGARYIEIFESSKGDMFQAVQQHGFFTSVGGRRRHHWHQAHAPGGGGGGGHGAATAQYAADVGSGGGHGRGSQMDEMMGAFAGGWSRREPEARGSVPGQPQAGSACFCAYWRRLCACMPLVQSAGRARLARAPANGGACTVWPQQAATQRQQTLASPAPLLCCAPSSCPAGFGLSQRDMQVPGPPRWGAYGAPADQAYPYGGMPPRQMQQAGMMQPGAMRWRPSAQMQQTGMQHFNPAPGPPPGKVRWNAAGGLPACVGLLLTASSLSCGSLGARPQPHPPHALHPVPPPPRPRPCGPAGPPQQYAQRHTRRRHVGHAWPRVRRRAWARRRARGPHHDVQPLHDAAPAHGAPAAAAPRLRLGHRRHDAAAGGEGD